MPECAVCSAPAPNKCARCKCVFYCSPAHQKEDWPAHKVQCPRLAQEALSAVFHPCDEDLLLRITTCLAQNGYHKEVGVILQLNKAFWNDEQIWDAYKDVPGPRRRTRLIYASGRGWLHRVQRLLARGARPNGSSTDGFTPLMAACRNGYHEVVRELALRGANVNASLTSDGSTPLTFACQDGHYEAVCELLKSGASVNTAKTNSGFTPLMFASQGGYLKVVRELVAWDADINATATSDGSTALFIASQNGHLEVVRELIAKGANMNATKTDSGSTALIMASQWGHLEVVRELIERDADVNIARTDNGTTALMLASIQGHLEIARLLLKKGANKSATTFDGETAFTLASYPHKAALQALLKP